MMVYCGPETLSLQVYCSNGKEVGYIQIQGVPTQTVTFHFALAGRNMQASFGLKVIWES